ncbi:FKBP-type peptidyl-prolyl cis-trans isomerase [Ferrimonas balearica]|uniref:FKBP-type peptidyl-prolyl cis-trans isomerase n=1 Tax=Ferrimonas balearica TaxID=44012 RepID=UPI001C99861B|nr:FKBP-type peptidyl-prolyl cis-trans isomerase [Ferrimonas balearica]MBY5920626.1 FKBP-type peptidyl-prolyl cis-trans isomerase [Ferrimonas balearica]MBY5996689.1 FKBP-type peptidyl-prolyl cis-trans isomerase [Ferrimonas balearica]
MSKIVLIVIVLALVGLFLQRSIANKKVASENAGVGSAFLAENAKQEGVETTASGLQYQVLVKGEGTEHPGPTSKVKVHYHGTLIDGTVFDSSVERGEPISFGLNQVIKGWTEGLQLMSVGDKYRLFIPAELGYGNRGVGAIPAGSVLIFDVELLGVN